MFLSWTADMAFDGYRFVIAGAGPAGLFLARRLASRGRVLVLEAGSADEAMSGGDGYYEIVPTGLVYPPIGTRLSGFGGTSNHWGGHSRPLAPEVFEARPGFAAWPLRYEDFAAHLDEAAHFLNLKPFRPAGGPDPVETGVLAGYENLVVTPFQYSDPIRRLGDAASLETYRAERDIDVLVETRVTEIGLASGDGRVQSITLLHRPSRESRVVDVPQLILCAGGIENARLMLWSGRALADGNPLVGGPNQLTGTHFTEKSYFSPVELFIDSRAALGDAFRRDDHPADIAWELSEPFRRANGLPRFGVFPGRPAPLASSTALDAIAPAYASQAPAYVRLDPDFQVEQTPHAASYVALSRDLDADGVGRPELHWQLLGSDYADFRKAVLMFCGILSQKGLARARLKPEFRGEDWTGLELGHACHHLGTTRMGDTRLDGVVNADCRVHGLDNLYVAGSSVFPSADYVNPTLNLVALAGRLADHLIAKLEVG